VANETGHFQLFCLLEAGVPVGGVISFNFGLKTECEAAICGGEAGVSHGVCYHAACDDFNNANNAAIDELTGAAAHTVLVMATQDCSTMAPTTSHGTSFNRGPLLDLGVLADFVCLFS
jgi:hypothetical protein